MPHPDFRVAASYLTALLVLALAACGTSVDPNHAADAGSDTHTIGSSDVATGCPADPSSAIGTACSAEGQVCGDCTNPCSFCNLIRCTSGHWMAEEVFPDCDASVASDVTAPAPDLLISWQAPGGFAGTGPAVIVQGDGSVRVWNSTTGFAPTAAPTAAPDATYNVGAPAVADLLARWNASNHAALPHGPATNECSATLYVRPCAACEASTLQYASVAQGVPELQPVFAWFESNLPTAVRANDPANYCGP